MTITGLSERVAVLDDRGRRVFVRMVDGQVRAAGGHVLVPGVGDELLGEGLVLLDRSPMSIRFAGAEGRAVRRIEIDGSRLTVETDGELTSRTLEGG